MAVLLLADVVDGKLATDQVAKANKVLDSYAEVIALSDQNGLGRPDGVNQNWGGPIQQIQFGFPGNAEIPLAADMDMDGIDDIGLFVPRRSGTTVEQDAEWYFLVSNFPARVGAVPVPLTQSINHPFSPSPLGHDIHAQFGDEFALPILGNTSI